MTIFLTRLGVAVVIVSAFGESAAGDDFERLEGEALAAVTKSATVKAVNRLSQDEMGRLPRVVPGVRSTVLVVKTGEGNLARLMVSIARRLPAGADGVEAPVLIVERYATFAAGGYRQRLARGRELMLFDGYRLDLDTGQVVPEGYGGDLRVRVDPIGAVALEAEPGAILYCFKESPIPQREAGRPRPGRRVVSGDFAGRFRMVADGRWSGLLELDVDEGGRVSGSYRSDQTGSVSKVRGEIVVGEETPRFEGSIEFPRARFVVTGWLWSDGKDAMAGTARLLERDYGFVAIREGRTMEPPGLEGFEADRGGAADVTLRLTADGRLWRDEDEIDPAAPGPIPGETIRIRVAGETHVRHVDRVLHLLKQAGLADLRLDVETRADDPSSHDES